MLRIGICDDQVSVRDTLRFLLTRLLRQDDAELLIYEFSSGEGFLSWLQKHDGELDLLFLDIEMQDLNGMETARKIRERDTRMVIVFATGYTDYVFDGYTVGALDYLIKPVTEDRLKSVLTRTISILHCQSANTFTLRNAEGLYRVPVDKILYVYSDRRQVTLVTATREYSFYEKLDNVAGTLGNGFVRIHQRYLVRADAVDQIEGSSVLIGQTTLPISRAYRQTSMLSFARATLRTEEI